MQNAIDIVSIAIALLSLAISGYTAWRTLLQSGTVKMTQPTIVFFGYEGASPKVVVITLLFSTSHRGHVIESMYVKLKRSETVQTFSRWVYGAPESPGASGIHVGPQGVAGNHHFLLPGDGTRYEFLPGDCVIEVYASLVGNKTSVLLKRLQISLTPDEAQALNKHDSGVLFNWSPELSKYIAETKGARVKI